MENTQQNFSLDRFMENQMTVNKTLSKSNKDISEAIVYFSQALDEIKTDYKGIEKEVAILKKDKEGLKITIEEVKDNYKKLKEITYVLSTDDGKMKELTKLIQRLVYKQTGGRNTDEDILFHRALVNGCYKNLYNIFQINSYKRIHIDEYETALTSIKHWFKNERNITRVINKKLKEYTELDSKDKLSSNISKILNTYMEELAS